MILVRANGCAVESDRVDESSRVKPIRDGLQKRVSNDRFEQTGEGRWKTKGEES